MRIYLNIKTKDIDADNIRGTFQHPSSQFNYLNYLKVSKMFVQPTHEAQCGAAGDAEQGPSQSNMQLSGAHQPLGCPIFFFQKMLYNHAPCPIPPYGSLVQYKVFDANLSVDLFAAKQIGPRFGIFVIFD